MKIVFLTLLFIVGIFGRSAVNQHQTRAEGPECPIQDPLVVPGGPVNISLHPVLVLNDGSMRGELTVLGLSSLHFNYEINLITLTAEFEITLDSVDLQFPYSGVTGWVDVTPLRPETLPSGTIEAMEGDAKITAKSVHVKGSGTLFINIIGDRISIRILVIDDLSFDELTMDLSQGYLLDGATVDWTTLSANFKANFDQDFANFKSEIVDKIKTVGNIVIGQYTLEDFLELIGNIGGGCPTPAPGQQV